MPPSSWISPLPGEMVESIGVPAGLTGTQSPGGFSLIPNLRIGSCCHRSGCRISGPDTGGAGPLRGVFRCYRQPMRTSGRSSRLFRPRLLAVRLDKGVSPSPSVVPLLPDFGGVGQWPVVLRVDRWASVAVPNSAGQCVCWRDRRFGKHSQCRVDLRSDDRQAGVSRENRCVCFATMPIVSTSKAPPRRRKPKAKTLSGMLLSERLSFPLAAMVARVPGWLPTGIAR